MSFKFKGRMEDSFPPVYYLSLAPIILSQITIAPEEKKVHVGVCFLAVSCHILLSSVTIIIFLFSEIV